MTKSPPEECLVPFHEAYPTPCPDIRTELPHGL